MVTRQDVGKRVTFMTGSGHGTRHWEGELKYFDVKKLTGIVSVEHGTMDGRTRKRTGKKILEEVPIEKLYVWPCTQ